MADPIQDGLVASLARPGGNLTGLTFLAPELLPKLVTLVKDPPLTRLAALWHPSAFSERTMTEMVRETETAARNLEIRLRLIAFHSSGDIEPVFQRQQR
jgi:putative ABC transport system substrate-binding protein